MRVILSEFARQGGCFIYIDNANGVGVPENLGASIRTLRYARATSGSMMALKRTRVEIITQEA